MLRIVIWQIALKMKKLSENILPLPLFLLLTSKSTIMNEKKIFRDQFDKKVVKNLNQVALNKVEIV